MRLIPPFTSGQTLFGHGIYLAAIALVLFFAPWLLRSLLPFPAELDWWNRVLALPVFNLGILCIGIARAGSQSLLWLSVAMRLWVMATLAALFLIRLVPAVALVIGIVDLASAALLLGRSRLRLSSDQRGQQAAFAATPAGNGFRTAYQVARAAWRSSPPSALPHCVSAGPRLRRVRGIAQYGLPSLWTNRHLPSAPMTA